MVVLDLLKNKTTLKEVLDLPNNIFHTFYYRHYLKYKDKQQASNEDMAEQMMNEMEELEDENGG